MVMIAMAVEEVMVLTGLAVEMKGADVVLRTVLPISIPGVAVVTPGR